mmetsp:Transcript_9455/g.23201  ORF Transcript_9455/g.23201 Transcript_9455/m.23201 type:complete len:244 (+) Transcript_9455:110-841(+)
MVRTMRLSRYDPLVLLVIPQSVVDHATPSGDKLVSLKHLLKRPFRSRDGPCEYEKISIPLYHVTRCSLRVTVKYTINRNPLAFHNLATSNCMLFSFLKRCVWTATESDPAGIIWCVDVKGLGTACFDRNRLIEWQHCVVPLISVQLETTFPYQHPQLFRLTLVSPGARCCPNFVVKGALIRVACSVKMMHNNIGRSCPYVECITVAAHASVPPSDEPRYGAFLDKIWWVRICLIKVINLLLYR